MKLIRSGSSISRTIAAALTLGFCCWVVSAQDAGPAKELIEWVTKARKAGMSEDQIQKNAALAGWQPDAVSEALRATATDAPKGDAKAKPASPGSTNDQSASAAQPAGQPNPDLGAKNPAGGSAATGVVTLPAPGNAASPISPAVGGAKAPAVPPTTSPTSPSPTSPSPTSPSATSPAPAEAGAGVPKPVVDHGVPDDYQIGAGDGLHIAVWHEPDATVPSAMVRPDGKISMPLLKEVNVLGLTPSQLEKELTQQLTKFYTAPDVTVIVTAINSKKIYAIGAVKKEGPIPYTYRMSVLQALSEAGGLTDYAKRKKIYILRTQNGREFRLPFDYDAVLKGEHMELNYPLIAGDTIVVPH